MNNGLPNDAFLARWLNGELSDDELRDWYAHPEYEDLRKIAEVSGQFAVPNGLSKEEAWKNILEKTSRTDRRASAPVRRIAPAYRWTAAVAAAAALIFAVYFLTRDTVINLHTPSGEKYTFYLPDSSRVTINAESELSYNQTKWSQSRTIYLNGEAYFEVAKGKTFTVNAQSGKVEVLGTKFNVKARNRHEVVTCFEGKVRVSPASGSETRDLSGGMGVKIIDQTRLSDFSFVNVNKPGWTEGMLAFDEVPFREVVEELERQYGVSVDFPEIEALYTGAFFDNDLENALLLVCEPMGLSFVIEDSTHITLSPNP
ncbi:MAG: FecR domain-containing protein [Bacteroidia bacterium]